MSEITKNIKINHNCLRKQVLRLIRIKWLNALYTHVGLLISFFSV